MEKFDDILSFDLPPKYYVERGINEDGVPIYRVNSEQIQTIEGDEKSENSALIKNNELEDSPFVPESLWYDSVSSVNGNLDAAIAVALKEMNVMHFNIKMYTAIIWIHKDHHVYAFLSARVVNDEDDSCIEKWIAFMNNLLDSVVLDGIKGDFEKITIEKLFSCKIDLDEEAEKNSDIPFARPLEEQHTHLDFLNDTKASLSLFGVAVNQTGTEYSFVPIKEMAEAVNHSELTSLYSAIVKADSCKFELAQVACDMSKLFRINIEFFDPSHDREQEILHGMIQRAEIYNKFRSFAWTLQAFCEKEGCNPAELNFSTIQSLVDFITDRQGLNYVANSYSPAICSGDDLHNYFVPNSISAKKKKRLLEIVNEKIEDNPVATCDIRSLDSLRNEISYMYPAIKTIYDELETTRNYEEPLTDDIADILYAWCSMTYAARQPIFTEDGPVNCMWEHPDRLKQFERELRKAVVGEDVERNKEWVKQHRKDLSKNVTINFKGKIFVFDGVKKQEQWKKIQAKLVKIGGIERTAISGKTDYLVCDPMNAGNTKIKQVLEQRKKGKDIKIILYDDFIEAINGKKKVTEEKVKKPKTTSKKNQAERKTKEAKEIKKSETDKLCQERELVIKKYEEECNQWEKECKLVEEKRASYVEKKIADEKENLEKKAISKRNKAVSKALKTISKETLRKQTAEKKLYELGIFKFSEKNLLKATIEDAEMKIDDAKNARELAESEFKTEMSNLDNESRNKIMIFWKYAADEYPMPDKPKNPEMK